MVRGTDSIRQRQRQSASTTVELSSSSSSSPSYSSIPLSASTSSKFSAKKSIHPASSSSSPPVQENNDTDKEATMRPGNKINILPRLAEESYNLGAGGSGSGGSMTGRRKAFPWKKFAIGTVVFLGVVWLAGPKQRYRSYRYGETDLNAPVLDDDLELDLPKKAPLAGGVAHPTSPETDPNPLKTTYCTRPKNPSKPLVQYALMIDAGSQGSRIHVYKFNNCDVSSSLEYEAFIQTRPGLSAFAGNPRGAAESLDMLMESAVKYVPKSLAKCTPVAVKATAGLRLLGHTESEDILTAVKDRLVHKYPFKVIDKDPVVIMDGKAEGVYAWITVNYLLNNIGTHIPSSSSTYAVLDLGGASTQIVFEPTFSKDSLFVEGDHKYTLKFGGKTHTLYQHSYLGYGIMRARQSVHNLVYFMSQYGHSEGSSHKSGGGVEPVVGNPCISKTMSRSISLDGGGWTNPRNVSMAGEDVGSFEGCKRIVELVMAKDAICEVKPCSFNGVYQPSILDTFSRGGVLTLSYFTDRIAPLLPSTTHTLPVSQIAILAQRVCAGPDSWKQYWGHDTKAMEELQGRPEYCLDLTFQYALLRLGYEFGDQRQVRIEKKLHGTELGWCLGATIAMLDAELTCTI